MDSQTPRLRPLPNVKFRVLVAGRANAGKTTILQRVCETTESPKVYRVTVNNDGKATREMVQLDPTSERGEHNISDELVFSNHNGYVFHDTRGLEIGSMNELQIVQNFVRDRSQRGLLQSRLHAIWYCIPMDNQRPASDIEPYRQLCLAKNVPMIAVFTKYEAFKRNVGFRLEDKYRRKITSEETDRECQLIFETKYLSVLGGARDPAPIFVCLEGMDKPEARCQNLIQRTADALSPNAVAIMLLALRSDNIRLNVHVAFERKSMFVTSFSQNLFGTSLDNAVMTIMRAFPALWWSLDEADDERAEAAALRLAELRDAVADLRYLVDHEYVDEDDEHVTQRRKEVVHSLKRFLIKITFSKSRAPSALGHIPFIIHWGFTKQSHLALTALIIILRFTQIIYFNMHIPLITALQKAYKAFYSSNLIHKLNQWLAAHPDQSGEQLEDFIDSIPLDFKEE